VTKSGLRTLCGAAALALLAAGTTARPALAEPRAFRIGEKLTFSIQYGFVRAGTAELEVRPGDGDGSWILTSRARTNSFFDVFFKVRDEVRSWVDPETMETLRFEKTLSEGKFQDEETILFDRGRNVAVYDDGKEAVLTDEARDVLAAFYHLRSQRLPIGERVPVAYHASKKNWSIEVRIGKAEMVEVPAGKFRCVCIEPFLKSVGVFKQTGRLRIWVTADERRMPVKLESKVTFGAFEAVLTGYHAP
jgi:hypothetical protein